MRLSALAFGMAGALLIFPLGSLGGSTAANTWTGTWGTSAGQMTLTQSGAKLSGDYTHDKGKIVATINGNVATGKWSEAPTYAGPGDAGPMRFVLSADGKSFTGTWSYDGVSGGGGWSGDCTSGACTANRVQDVTARYRFSATGKNRIGSRLVGGGTFTQTTRGSSTTSRAAGTFAHVDDYFTKDQDEHLTLRVIAARLLGGYNPGHHDGNELRLTVFVTHTDHPKACPAGAKGTLEISEEDDAEGDEADMLLRVCGREHGHHYVNTRKYPVHVSITKSG